MQILVFAISALFLSSAFSYAAGFRNQTGNCSVTGCHNDSTGMTLVASSLSIEANIGDSFDLNISAVGEVCKFPLTLANNSDFTYQGLDAEGMVSDGDVADLDPDATELMIEYSITTPDTPGSYLLWIFAATHTPSSISIQIAVTVTSIIVMSCSYICYKQKSSKASFDVSRNAACYFRLGNYDPVWLLIQSNSLSPHIRWLSCLVLF
jgi:hypothetical protein